MDLRGAKTRMLLLIMGKFAALTLLSRMETTNPIDIDGFFALDDHHLY
jgi:hypothetical protein